MDPIKELPKSITAGLSARARNPLLGSFLISWAIYNWRVWIHLASSSDSVGARISAIESLLSTPHSHLIPLMFALAYVFFSPWLSLFVKWYLDIAYDRGKRRERSREVDELAYRQDFAEREAKLLHAQRVRLQNIEELDRVREQLNVYFEQTAVSFEARAQRVSERLERRASEIELETIPSLELKLEKIRDEIQGYQDVIARSMNRLREEAMKRRMTADFIKRLGVNDNATDAPDNIPNFLKKQE